MKLVYGCLLVTCIFAINQHVASSDQGSKAPKILSVTLSPPGPVKPGTEINATARIYSPLEEPKCKWKIFGLEKKYLEDELIALPNKTYESSVSLGPIRRSNDVFLDASNSYGVETKHIEFSFGERIGKPCKTSTECLMVTSNSECEPKGKRCRCEPGYGVYGIEFEEKNQTCKKYPIHQVKTLEIGKDKDMACRINVDYFSEINWYRNGTICTYESSYCSQDNETVYVEEIFSSQRRLWLKNVMTSDNYTCQATTTDGRSWTVSETEIVVVPRQSTTIYLVSGSDYDRIQCGIYDLNKLPVEVLVRDGKDVCTTNSTWCSIHGWQRYSVLNLRANHNFTCETVLDNDTTAAVYVFNFIVGEIPKILELTFSPNGTVPNGTEVVATARILSPSGKPHHQWKLSDHVLEDNFTLVSGNEYESRVSLGPIRPRNSISFEVSNEFGKDKQDSNILVALKYGDWCGDGRQVICTSTNDDIECRDRSCSCREGFVWDVKKRICRKYAGLREPCEISLQCSRVNLFSECDQEKKICFCQSFQGLDYELDDKECQNYPFEKVKYVSFEEETHLQCKIFTANMSEIQWYRYYRNQYDREYCTPNATWCVQDETTYDEKTFSYSSDLTLPSVIRDAIYTCHVIRNGIKWDVKNTKIFVAPPRQETRYQTFGEDHNISCSIRTPNLEVRLVRDGKESCTPGAIWCSQENNVFTILNQRTSSNYTCEAYSGDEKLATVANYQILIDSKPKILKVTHSPVSPVQKGTEVVATAIFFHPKDQPIYSWTLNKRNVHVDPKKLRFLAENIYESKVSLGNIDRSSEVLFEVTSSRGGDATNVKIETSGATVQKGGIIMIALIILLTLFQSTTSTVADHVKK